MKQIFHWIYGPLVNWGIYYYDKKSKYDLDVIKIYQSLWGGTFFILWEIAAMLTLLSDSLHIALLDTLSSLFMVLAFTCPFILEFILKRKKYVETLIEQYRTMAPEEQRSQARIGWYQRILPVIGLAIFFVLFMIYSALA